MYFFSCLATSIFSLIRTSRDWGDVFMNEQNLESWSEIKSKIKSRWSNILDEDLEALKDSKELLVSKIQQVYGHAKERAEKDYEEFVQMLKATKKVIKKN